MEWGASGAGTVTEGTEKIPVQPPAENPGKESAENDLRTLLAEMKGRANEVPIYVRYLRTGTEFERTRAAEALGEIGDAGAVQPLIDALSDPSSTVQYLAAKSLGSFHDPRAVDPLIGKLRSESKWVRRASAETLGKLGDARAVDPLILLLGDPKHDVRAHAAEALGRLGKTRAIEPLKALLADTSEDVRKEARAALEKLEGVPAPVPDASIHA